MAAVGGAATPEPGLRLVAAPPDASPALHRDDDLHVVLDGILFDRDELAAALGAEPGSAAADVALAAMAYRRWGESALDRMRGVFALVLWDRSSGALLCARDPIGFQPLYHAEGEAGLLVSPSPTSLVAQPGVDASLNRAGMVDYLARRWLVPEETYFSAVRRIPPGHLLRVGSAGGRTCRRYWSPAPYREPIDWIPDSEAADGFAERLDRALRRSLRLGSPGILLSGGIDSATVAMAAADLCTVEGSRPPLALSMLFPKPYDEAVQQRGVAEALDLKHVLVSFDEAAGADGIFASALELSATLAAPLFNIWAPAYAHLLRAARRDGRDVVLTGDGGDDLHCTPPHYAADLVGSLQLVGLLKLWRTYARSHPQLLWARLPTLGWRYGLAPLLQASRAGRRLHALLPARAQASGPGPGAETPVVPERWMAPDPSLHRAVAERLGRAAAPETGPVAGSAYAARLRSALDSSFQWQRYEENHTLGRRTGVRFYDPLWDPDLADFAMRVRPEVSNRSGYTKGLLREPLARRFPRLGFDRQEKRMLGTFISPVVAREARSALKRVGKRWVLSDLGLVDPDGLTAFMEAAQGHKGWRVWDVLNLEFWARARLG